MYLYMCDVISRVGPPMQELQTVTNGLPFGGQAMSPVRGGGGGGGGQMTSSVHTVT